MSDKRVVSSCTCGARYFIDFIPEDSNRRDGKMIWPVDREYDRWNTFRCYMPVHETVKGAQYE